MPISAEIENTNHGRRGAPGSDVEKRTILIYSPDLKFSFSLSMVFEDRFQVVTTPNTSMLESFAATYDADIAIVDAVPSDRIIGQIDRLKSAHPDFPVILTYVYDARYVALDQAARGHVDAVLYKPFEVESILSHVSRLIRS